MIRINFGYEANEVIAKLKQVKGYLDCENIVIQNIKKHVENGDSVNEIECYLKELHIYLQNKMIINKGNITYINFMYATGFLNIIICDQYWQVWLNSLGINTKTSEGF